MEFFRNSLCNMRKDKNSKLIELQYFDEGNTKNRYVNKNIF